jgi:hypothetical protein
MAVWVSSSRSGRAFPPGRLLVRMSVRGWVDPRAIVQLEGLGQLKNLMTSSGIEPATFRLVAQSLNQLYYGVMRVSAKRDIAAVGQNSWHMVRSRSQSDSKDISCLQERSKLKQQSARGTLISHYNIVKRNHVPEALWMLLDVTAFFFCFCCQLFFLIILHFSRWHIKADLWSFNDEAARVR